MLLSKRTEVSVGADLHEELAIEARNSTNRLRSIIIGDNRVAILSDDRSGKKRLKVALKSNCAATGAATAMRRAKRLVQVQVHAVEAMIAGPGSADHRVHVCAVAENLSARIVKHLTDLLDVRLEQAEG